MGKHGRAGARVGEPATKILFAKIEYLGILSRPPLWLTFVLAYTEHDRWLGNRLVCSGSCPWSRWDS
jgi:hypothetical protein